MERKVIETSKDYAILDQNTGEIKDLKITKTVTQEDFVLLFLKAFLPKAITLDGNQLKILLCCWQYSTFNPKGSIDGNIFNNNSMFKEYVRGSGLSLTDNSIDVYISNLAKMKLLIKKCKGGYLINPEYFFRGTLTDNSRLRLELNTKAEE